MTFSMFLAFALTYLGGTVSPKMVDELRLLWMKRSAPGRDLVAAIRGIRKQAKADEAQEWKDFAAFRVQQRKSAAAKKAAPAPASEPEPEPA